MICSHSGDGDTDYKLIIASSTDYVSNAHVFCGPDVGSWKDCEIPGRSLFATCSLRRIIFREIMLVICN